MVKEYLIEQYGKRFIQNKYDNKEMYFGTKKSDQRIRWVGIVYNNENDTQLELYTENKYTTDWYKRLESNDTSFHHSTSTQKRYEKEHEKSSFIKEIEKIVFNMIGHFEELNKIDNPYNLTLNMSNHKGEVLSRMDLSKVPPTQTIEIDEWEMN